MWNPFRRQHTELERFLTYLDRESSGTFGGGDAWRLAEREREQDDARTILSFATGTTSSSPPTTVEELIDLVSPGHEGWGLDRRPVEDWVHRFREQDQ